jgi:transposase
MRRSQLRGRENTHKRYLIHVAGHNLRLLMRQLFGAVTPKEAAARPNATIFAMITPTVAIFTLVIVTKDDQIVFLVIDMNADEFR